LSFQRNANLQSYRRAYNILYDLKYLLTTLPEEWDDNLRRGFLHGASLLFDIQASMQGMDQQLRQVSHHVEYELEWESAFNLHIKIAPVASLLCSWAATDRVVFVKTIRMLFKKIFEEQRKASDESYISLGVCNKTATCLEYAVSSKPVSMHLPLTRLLAGLCLHMQKFGLNLQSHEFHISEKPSIVQMMEPSLRTIVLIAQVQAGMWRRNGYALVDQVRVYHDPRCRREMYDQDIIMLQVAAANFFTCGHAGHNLVRVVVVVVVVVVVLVVLVVLVGETIPKKASWSLKEATNRLAH
jgi:E3 ubiquitin-protein ligase UBR2